MTEHNGQIPYAREISVRVQRRDSYGTVRIYPICDTAKLLARLTGRKTFSGEDLGVIEALGYRIEWVPMNLEDSRGS